MAAPIDVGSYKEILLVLGTAAVIVPAVIRFGFNPVFGFLLAGAFLGPDGLGQLAPSVPWLGYITVNDRTQITHLAEAGVVFLLFMIGLELSFERLRTMRRLVFGLGTMQVVATGAVFTAILVVIGVNARGALLLGFAFALSSTAIVVQMLADQKRLGSSTGRTAFAILLMQDLAVVPLLVMVGVLGRNADESIASSLGLSAIKAVIAVSAIVLLGRYILRPLFRAVARTRSSELFMAASLLVVIGTGVITAASGLSMALGAFIAGLILAETEYRREVEATIEPFKGLLLGVFFFSVGMSIDLANIVATPVLIAALLAALLAIKLVITVMAARLMRVALPTALETAFLLAPAGEFAFVLLTQASGVGLLDDRIAAIGTAVASLSMALIPMMALIGQRLKARLTPPGPARSDVPAPPVIEPGMPHAIVAGYGRVGELVADMLSAHKLDFVALDSDPDLVARGHTSGRKVYVGDASNVDMLKRCGLGSAKVLVITMDSRAAVEKVARAARSTRPDLTIVARAKDPAHAALLYAAGVTEAVPEAIEASLHISEAALIGAGVPLGLVIASIHEQRDTYRATFQRIQRQERDPVARLRARRLEVKKGEG